MKLHCIKYSKEHQIHFKKDIPKLVQMRTQFFKENYKCGKLQFKREERELLINRSARTNFSVQIVADIMAEINSISYQNAVTTEEGVEML